MTASNNAGTTVSGPIERLKRSILDLDMDATIECVKAIVQGESNLTAAQGIDAVSEALRIVGARFQNGEWFVGELVYAGEITKEAMRLLTPLLAAGAARSLGTIVVGTVAGDLHDLGKNIFSNYARGAGFEIIDLGVDVPAQRFVDAANEHRPVALGMSCLLTVTAGEIGKVINELKQRGLRDDVKVIIGGAALTEAFATEVGADAFAADAVTGTDVVKQWSSW
jgi:methanogenic corrinoid protein MtbC1